MNDRTWEVVTRTGRLRVTASSMWINDAGILYLNRGGVTIAAFNTGEWVRCGRLAQR